MAYDPNKVNLGADLPTTPTASERDPWQEALTKFRTVPASKVLEAADVIRDLNGSWAAHYVLEPGYRDSEGIHSEDAQEPSNRAIKSSRLGQPGVPEINFDPYTYRTNRFAHKGGSLLGHPISFSVVGPTLKRDGVKFTNWQWTILDNKALPNVGDELSLDEIILDPVALGPIARTFGLFQRYGITSMADVPNGLYVAIIQTGEIGRIIDPVTGNPVVGGSTGDGFVFQDAPPIPLRVPIQSLLSSSKYEIFRVVDLATRKPGPEPDTLVLDPGKRISSYFNLTPGEINTVRAVMLFEPRATRLLAVPDSGTKGAEQVFVVVPPDRALRSDQQYPRTTDPAQPTQPQGWLGPVFEEPIFPGLTADGNVDPYSEYEWQMSPHTPLPRVSGQGIGRLYGEWTPTGPEIVFDYGPGRMVLGRLTGHAPTTGQILHIHDARTRGNPRLNGVQSVWSQADIPAFDSLLGWFEVVRQVAYDKVLLRRISEMDPIHGHSYFGASVVFHLDQAPLPVQGDRVELHYTAHDQINQLWRTNYFDIDQVESARLTNIINPDWVERLIKDQPRTPARADRAIFDTASSGHGTPGTNADPGSLLDLGFRVVLYPAKLQEIRTPWPDDAIGWDPAAPTWGRTQLVTRVVPDFDRPVVSNEVLLDPGPTVREEKQFVEVDYSNGLIRFSHAPAIGGDLWPTTDAVFTADDNPRGEMVVFAACVPYSMEEGQLGSAIRATASPPTDDPCTTHTVESLDQHDVFGGRVWFPLEDQVITSTAGSSLIPAIILTQNVVDQIPQTGFVDILEVGDIDLIPGEGITISGGDPAFTTYSSRGATFGYYGTLWDPTGAVLGQKGTGLLFPYGGGIHGTSITVDCIENPAIAVLRRDVTTPNSVDAILGTPYQDDTTYGDSWRAKALRFENADIKGNADGTTTIRMQEILAERNQQTLGDLFSTWILEGGELTHNVTGTPTVEVTHASAVILHNGRRIVVPREMLDIGGANGIYYMYLQSNALVCWTMDDENSLPLPSPNDILLGMVVLSGFPGSPVVTVTDLRYPLEDVDRRWDVTVGKLGGGLPKWDNYAPHFDKMADAVKYVNEVMRPKGGTADRHLRIRVVGPTDEDAGDLPIKFWTDGVIIEGANRLRESHSGGSGDPVELRWDADSAFFDFNSSAGLVFRNLTFRWTGAVPGVLAAPVRTVFTQGDEPSAFNIVIDHCAAYGYVQGLLKVTSDHQIHGLTLTRCYMEEALDFGVFAPGGGNFSQGWTIRDNTFAQYSSGGSMVNVGAITTNGRYDTIENNTLVGFEKGVLVWGNFGPTIPSVVGILRNNIHNTLLEGIVVEDDQGSQVIGNALTGIHQSVPAVARTGIWVKDGPAHKVDDNLVELDSPVAGDLAIHVEGTGLGNIVSDNDVVEDTIGAIQVTAKETQVKGNKCKDLIIDAESCCLEANWVTNLCKLTADYQRLSDNRIHTLEAGFDVSTDSFVSSWHIIQGNSLTTLYPGSDCVVGGNIADTCYARSRCTLNDNTISHLLDYKAGPVGPHLLESGDRISMTGNRFSSTIGDGADGIFGCERAVFDGNLFLAGRVEIVGPDNSFTGNQVQAGDCRIDGTNNVVSGNNVTSGDLEIYDTKETTGQSSVTGNVVQGAHDIIVNSNAPDTVVSGNHVGVDINIQATGCTVNGNRVNADIALGATIGDCTIVGNNCNNITGNALQNIAVANRVRNNLVFGLPTAGPNIENNAP